LLCVKTKLAETIDISSSRFRFIGFLFR